METSGKNYILCLTLVWKLIQSFLQTSDPISECSLIRPVVKGKNKTNQVSENLCWVWKSGGNVLTYQMIESRRENTP